MATGRQLAPSCAAEPAGDEMVHVSFNISITWCNWFNLAHVGLCTFLCKYAGLFFLQHKCGEILGLTYYFLTTSFAPHLRYVLDVQVDESIAAANAATRLSVTWFEAAVAPACCSEASPRSGAMEV